MACPQLDSSLSTVSTSSCPLPASQHPCRLSISSDVWRVAEERIEEMLCVFQPSVISQDRRNEVIEYVQRVIGSYLGTEIFPYGSVPLRTYLPDGDIDLTVMCNQTAVDDLVRNLFNMADDRCKDPEFLLKDIQVVEAQVKIVKCTVKGISLDLSFNQVSGISALCFIEQVDRMIGREHLFKRSIILIKAWCLYESRVLGSYNGLISTYGLQIMVLYIINVFHSSLGGPLSVLHRFLDYFGKFDWQSYCLTLYGPVLISSLPNVVATPPENGNSELLLGKDFVDSYKQVFSSPIPETEPQRPFLIKNLNIMDPLNEKNNLGRSVSKANFFRIKFAFSYGSQKISEILMQQPMSRIGQELENFFKNTLDRNGRGERPDMEDHLFPVFGTGKFVTPSLYGEIDSFYSNLMHIRWQQQQQLGGFGWPSSSSEQSCTSQSSHNRAVLQYQSRNNQKASSVYVPRACSVEQACVPKSSGISEPPVSKGTGTFIPIMRNRPYYLSRSHLSWVRGGRNIAEGSSNFAEVVHREVLSHSSSSPSLCLRRSNTNVGVSVDEAPPQRRRRRSSHVGVSSSIGNTYSSSRGVVKGRPLPVIIEEEKEDDNDTSLLTLGVGSSECGDKLVANPYQLEDDMDFPPLSL